MIKIKKRSIKAAMLLLAAAIYGVCALCTAAVNENYIEVSKNQQQRRLTLLERQGTVYDRDLSPINNSENILYAVIPPDAVSLNSIKDTLIDDIDIESAVKNGIPLCLKVKDRIDSENITYVEATERYQNNQTASNILGYIDSSGIGISGIEKYGSDILNKYSGELKFTYTADSLGRMIAGAESTLDNKLFAEGGIVLTIDKELQTYAENIGSKIENGAIVVLSVPDAKILAMASFPLFDSSRPEDFILSENSPFIDKCTVPFAPGSVFKLVIAAAALNENIDIGNIYNCTGYTYSDNKSFSCFGGYAHGEVDLNLAITKSCNCYFMNLSKLISPSSMISAALNFGLGTQNEIFPGFFTSQGTLPSESSLYNNRALSNFAIGQGEVLLTPMQISGMINTIASRGRYTPPTLYEGETNNGKEITSPVKSTDSLSCLKVSDSLLLENYMASAVNSGTAKKGASEMYRAFAKTGTAETGKYKNGSQLLNYWYAGFIETEKHERYVIVVLNAEADENDNPTGEIFKAIGEYIAQNKL